MATYKLIFDDDDAGTAKTLVFEAADSGRAMHIAESEAGSRCAQLWRGGTPLCKIKSGSRDWKARQAFGYRDVRLGG